MSDDDDLAPTGHVWVCSACGKTSPIRWGHMSGTMHGWDESCMMHAFLAAEEKLVRGGNGRVIRVNS